VFVVTFPNESVLERMLPRESKVLWMTPRTVHVEHPDPSESVATHCPPTIPPAYVVELPSESVTVAPEVSVNTGPVEVSPATVTETGPLTVPDGTVVLMDVSLQLVIVGVVRPRNSRCYRSG